MLLKYANFQLSPETNSEAQQLANINLKSPQICGDEESRNQLRISNRHFSTKLFGGRKIYTKFAVKDIKHEVS